MDTDQNGQADAQAGPGWARRFLANVFWGWTGVVAGLIAGFFLSPYIVRKLGDARYGIWALTFAFIDYVNLFDVGFKSACVNFISQARARNDSETINRVINTAFFYFLGIAAIVYAVTWTVSGWLSTFFHIPAEYVTEFVFLIRIVGFAWVCFLISNVFWATVESFQRFRIESQLIVITSLIRSLGSALMLYLGHGLVPMGIVIASAFLLNHVGMFFAAKKAFPDLRISPRLVSRAMWKDLGKYGIHGFMAYCGQTMVVQGPPVMIGHMLSSAFVGYFTLPARLMQYLVELVTKISSVTMPNTAQFHALGMKDEIARMAIYLNRYCFALFLPFSVFILVFGRALITAWVGPGFAPHAAPLLLPLVIATSFATAGQYNSVGVLFGIAKHESYARSYIVEAVCLLIGLYVVLPRYGLLGGAWVAATMMVLNRGLFVPFVLCRKLEMNFFTYMRSVYERPLLLALPTVVFAVWLHERWIPGVNWLQNICALALIAIQFCAVYFFAGIEPEHRATLLGWMSRAAEMARIATVSAMRRRGAGVSP